MSVSAVPPPTVQQQACRRMMNVSILIVHGLTDSNEDNTAVEVLGDYIDLMTMSASHSGC